MAYRAFQAARDPGAEHRQLGFTEDQQFYLSFAQGWCTNRRDEAARMRLMVDTHSPPEYRVNGSLSDTPEFQAAFSCQPGSKMAPKDRCSVW